MARPLWSGYVVFGLVSVPIKLFTATRSHDISFNLLDRKSKSRIKLKYYCPHCEKIVEREELVRGFEYEKGKYVIIEDKDLKAIAPESSRSLEIRQFVDLKEVDPIYFEKTYYVGPDKGGEKTFDLLTLAMRETNKAGIGKLLMRDHEYLALLRPGQEGLMAHLMYYQDEIRENENKIGKTAEVRKKEIDLAKSLIDHLTEPFEPAGYENEYLKKLDQLIESKVTGRKIEVVRPKPRPKVENLMEALQKSIEQSRGANTRASRTRKKERKTA